MKSGCQNRIWLFAGLSFLGSSMVSSQTVLSLRDPFSGVSARATALGDAYISEAHEVGALYWNPASLAFVSRSFILSDYTYSPASKLAGYTLALPFFPGREQTFGAGFSFHTQPGTRDTSSLAHFTREYGIDLAFSTMVAYALSLGIRTGARYGSTPDSRAWAGFASLGLFYEPTPSISYAFVYNGLPLFSQGFETSSAQYKIIQQLPRNFQIGLSMHYPSSRKDHILTIGLANEKIIGQSGLIYKGGLEIGLFRFLTARVGYLVGSSVSEGRYGMGVGMDNIQIGYVFVPNTINGSVHQLSLYFEP